MQKERPFWKQNTGSLGETNSFSVVIELLLRQIVVVVMYYLGSNSEMNVSSTFRSVEATTAALASESSTGSLNVRYKVIFLMEFFDYKRK